MSNDRGTSLLALVASLTAISTVFVVARLFVRIKLLQSAGLDDFFIALALICALVNLGISSMAIESGSGRHFDTLTLEQKSSVIKYTIAAFCPGILSFAIPKLAVVSLLTKLLNPAKWHKIVLWVTAGASTLILFGCVIILYAQCTPTRSQWDFSIQGTCWSPWVLVYYAIVAGAISAFMDLYLALYPAVVLAKLQMRMRKKLALTAAMGLGCVASGVAAYKCSRIPGLAKDDFSWNTSELLIWTCVEGTTIIIATCIPIMQPLVKMFIDGSTPSSYAKKHGAEAHRGYTTPSIQLSSDLSKMNGGRTKARIYSKNATEVDSQESILGGQGRIGMPTDGVWRTDEVTISSSEQEKRGASRFEERQLGQYRV